ncbi:hypothetical protein CROQUDRAFT_78698 [Cronartium quercuum f. sp. fusiforme G11]|uniref:PX domain-containing protein n=1 Tax=Cronartium quercuum f. sp. fusiforme G11 TaxID=708437 RepID=A0A9P6TCF2_9BASI|nr:hypothetical protein CROQUDRAFT_78698 [Cronartium quercuum f. sp. fusiforme G11]
MPQSDQSSSEFDSDFDHRPHRTFIADAISRATSRPLPINQPNSALGGKSLYSSSNLATSPSLRLTKGTSRSESPSSQDDEVMTAPLKIRRTPSGSRVAHTSTSKATPLPAGAQMNVTASNLDRQFDDALYEATHSVGDLVSPPLPTASQKPQRLPSARSRPRFTRMKSAPALSRNASAVEQQSVFDSEANRASDLPYYGPNHDMDSDRKSLKMAGSRPPSISHSTRSRSRTQSVRSRASSAGSCLDEDEDAPVSGYLFLHAIPPLPPFSEGTSKGRAKAAHHSASPSPEFLTRPATEKGKGRQRSGTLSSQSHAIPKRPMPNQTRERSTLPEFDNTGSENSALPSPQHAWYLLRILVGLELRWELTRAWKLTSLDAASHNDEDKQAHQKRYFERDYLDSDDRSTYSLDSDSTTTSLTSDHFPILRYLIRHFLLTLPIIRDIVAMVPNNQVETEANPNDPEACSTVPVYWSAGILPICRRMHQANLSTSMELGSRGFLEIFCGVHCMRIIERFVATGVKIADTDHHPQPNTSSHTSQFQTSSSSTRFRSADKLPRDRIPLNAPLVSIAGSFNPQPHEEMSSSHTQRSLTSRHRLPLTDHPQNHDHNAAIRNSLLDPSAMRDTSMNTLIDSEKQIKTGIGREWQRISAASHAPSQTAEIGIVTPSVSQHLGSSSSIPDPRTAQPIHRESSEHNPYERITNEMSLGGNLECHHIRLQSSQSPSEPNLSKWLPNVFNAIEAPAMNLSETVGINASSTEEYKYVRNPLMECASAPAQNSGMGATIHRWDRAASTESVNINAPGPASRATQSSNPLSRLWYGWHRAGGSGSTDPKNDPDKRQLTSDFLHNGSYPEPSNVHHQTSGRETYSSPQPVLFVRSENQTATSADSSNQRIMSVQGYDVTEPEFDLRSSGRSEKFVRTPQTPDITFTSPAHYQKRSETSSRTNVTLIDGAEVNKSSENLKATGDHSESTEKVGTFLRKRRFTLKSISRRKNSPADKNSGNTSDAYGDVLPVSITPKEPHSPSHQSVNAMSPTMSRDISTNSSEKSLNQPRHRFYAVMAVPGALHNSISNRNYRHGVTPKPPSMPVQIRLPLVEKNGVDWPWGHPVPFWKGTPIHKVSWGGFEVDVVGLRRAFRGNLFLIRVRRPSRMDEYVLRDESHFKRYLAVLDKEFPSAVIRRIPDSNIRPEDDVIDPEEVADFFLRPTPASGNFSPDGHGDDAEDKNEVGKQRHRTMSVGASYRINIQPPSTFNTTRTTNKARTFSKGLDSRNIETQNKSLLSPNTGGSIRRRNTLGSLFRVGNHQSRFSLETSSDHSFLYQTKPTLPADRAELDKDLSRSSKKTNNFSSHMSRKLSIRSSNASVDAHRRALRGWLRDTLSIRMVGHHRETAAFLLLGSIVPKESDLLEIRQRETIDHDRRQRRILVAQGAAERAKVIHEWWTEVVEEFVNGNGLNNLSDAIRQCRTIEDLPVRFQKSIEWLQMNLAQGIHDMLVIGEQSDVFFEKLLSFNTAFPWFLLRNVFKIPKTKLMCKALMEVLLSKKATMKKKSVIQRLINISINEEEEDPLGMQKRIQACRARIQSLTMCEKLIKFAYGTRETKQLLRQYAESEKLELVVTIVRSAEEPRLDKYDLERVVRASKVYTSLLRKNRNRITKSMTENISVRLILDLKLYLRLISQERDTKQIQDMLSEDSILEALELLAAPFLEFLKRTYKIANASQAVDDAHKFVEQLITILSALRSRIQDPQKSVRIIARLLNRHQQALYTWIRAIHTQDPIIEEFFQWAWTAMMFLKRGLLEPVFLPQILPTTGLDDFKEELENVVSWQKIKRKLQYEHLCRRYSADVDGDDPVIVEGDGYGKSKVEPLIEVSPRPPRLEQIPRCLAAFRTAILHTFLV